MNANHISAADRRAHRRYVVDLPTSIEIGDRSIGCRLLDVSGGGALVEARTAVTVGDKVLLQIPGTGEVVATVIRTTPVSFALAFAGTVILSMAGDGEAPAAPPLEAEPERRRRLN